MNEIEKKFYNALSNWCKKDFFEICVDGGQEWTHDMLLSHLAYFRNVDFHAQYSEGIYIIDFVFIDRKFKHKFAIEIDGHESHKTKEQRYKDYCRERFLMKEGYTVIRFTASEVYVDANKCVNEVFEIIQKHDKDTSLIAAINGIYWEVYAYTLFKDNGGIEKFNNNKILQHQLTYIDFKNNFDADEYDDFKRLLLILGYELEVKNGK